MESWIRKACLQRAYRQLITWALLTAGAITISLAPQTYWSNFFHGPYPIVASDLDRPINPEYRFVTLSGTKIVDSGINETTTEIRNGIKGTPYVSSKYWLLVTGERLVVIKQSSEPKLHITGELKDLPGGMTKTIWPDDADADLRQRMYPQMVDTTDSYRLPGYVTFGAALLWALLLWVFARPAYKHISEITQHPVVRRVESWENTISVIHDVEQQIRTAVRFKRAGIIVTSDYVIVRTFF